MGLFLKYSPVTLHLSPASRILKENPETGQLLVCMQMYHNYVYFPGEGTSLNLLQVWHVLLRVSYYGPVLDRRICNSVLGMQN